MRRGKRPVGAEASARRTRGRAKEYEQPHPAEPNSNGCLRDFDLGLVPASVTPPKSSRYAAWFAIATSVLAFGGLITTANTLMSQPPGSAIADAPRFPRGNFDTSLPGQADAPVAMRGSDDAGPPESDPSALALPPHSRAGAEAPRSTQDSAGGRDAPGPQGSTSAAHSPNAASSPTGSNSSPDHFPPPAPGSSSPRPTAPPNPAGDEAGLRPFSGLPSLVERTELYFEHLCAGESHAAFELTAGALRERGYNAFVERHPATSCEITAVESGPSTVFATLRVTRPDGSTSTQRRELSFSAASPPGITSDVALP